MAVNKFFYAESAEPHDVGEEGYFIPMADLLAGILFVILMLLMSFAMVQYSGQISDIDAVKRSQVELARIQQLEQIKQARNELLQHLAKSLAAAGVPVGLDLDLGVLRFETVRFFEPGQWVLSAQGAAAVDQIAKLLGERLPCYASGVPGCAKPSDGRLRTVMIDVRAGSGDLTGPAAAASLRALAGGRALGFFARLVAASPPLFSLRSDAGLQLLRANGFQEEKSQIELNKAASAGASTKGTIELTFAMMAPGPLPGDLPIDVLRTNIGP